MASFVYNLAAKEIAAGDIDLLTGTVKLMLVNSTYTPNRDDDYVDEGGASDAIDAEIVATNYTGGWGGAGRKTLASKAVTEDDANDRAEFDAADVTWTALGNGSNDTIVGVIVIIEGGSDDLDSLMIAYLDIADTLTNGNDFTLIFDAQGIIQFSTV